MVPSVPSKVKYPFSITKEAPITATFSPTKQKCYPCPIRPKEYVEPTAYSGRYPVIGSWIIGGEAAGIGIRENRMEVTDNLSEFVPHIIG
jgi:hypothetical protein